MAKQLSGGIWGRRVAQWLLKREINWEDVRELWSPPWWAENEENAMNLVRRGMIGVVGTLGGGLMGENKRQLCLPVSGGGGGVRGKGGGRDTEDPE